MRNTRVEWPLAWALQHTLTAPSRYKILCRVEDRDWGGPIQCILGHLDLQELASFSNAPCDVVVVALATVDHGIGLEFEDVAKSGMDRLQHVQ